MISRDITPELLKLLTEYPVVTILGPRQSGKTTLLKGALKDYKYSNLEDPETRDFAQNDPKAYLAQFDSKVIIDEIQRVPDLLSYIQVIVDRRKENGWYVLTGSHQLQLQASISQSLAGRTAILNLLPLSISELKKHHLTATSFAEYCQKGFYPKIYAEKIRAKQMYANYYRTYVERDVRQLIQLKDASIFEKFLKLLAGRVGQLVDYSSLANDVGTHSKTIKSWLSILEASFIITKLAPYFDNFGKRIIKSPKYYFTDVGLLCFLLGIETAEQVKRDPLVGNIFENLVVVEAIKTRNNSGLSRNLYYFRDSNGNEVDLLFSQGRKLVAVEIKSGSTFSSKQLSGLRRFSELTDKLSASYLIYNGEQKSLSGNITALNFTNTDTIFSE